MTNWPTKKLGEVIEYEQPTKYLVSSTDYKDEYLIPVLTAGKSFLLGNTDEKSGVFPKEKLPIIIFDDFTTAIKFVDFPFKVKSSAMKILHAKKNKADIRFIFYKMLTMKFPHNQHKRYWISECSKIEIPLPPLATQKQIVERLDKIAEAQKLNDDLIQKTDELFQSLLHKELNPAGPADAKAMAGKKDWEIKKLGEVCEKTGQGQPKNFFKKEFRYIDISSINAEAKEIQDANLISVEGAPSRARKIVKAGDIVFATTRPYLENIAIVPTGFNNAIASTGFCVIRANAKIANPDFIYFTVISNPFIKKVLPFQRGANYPAVSDKDIFGIKIPLPPLETQKQIVAKLSAVQDYKKQLLGQKSKLKELFDSALHKSMNN
ncbi:MAG: restriction endonuclease subunit S [Candidatus Azambacteria bacterium]|nr:restriction endonuclease subunit S [Candidatus Azambacteria bacterium]